MIKKYRSGTMKLYNRQGVCLAAKRYAQQTHMADILKEWKATFSGFQSYYYQISPDIRDSTEERRKITEKIAEKC